MKIRCHWIARFGRIFRYPDKRRPVVVLTRDDGIDRLTEIIVVPATRTIRGLETELLLTPDDGSFLGGSYWRLRSNAVGRGLSIRSGGGTLAFSVNRTFGERNCRRTHAV